MRVKRSKLVAGVAVLGLLAAACGGDDDTNGAATTAAPDAEPEETADDVDEPDDTPAPDDTDDTDDAEAPDTEAPDTEAPDTPDGHQNMLGEPAADREECTADRIGGEATFGLARATESLDPTRALGSGVAGGIEIAAIYDTLILYDAANGTYLPHVAESVTANEELSEWTVTLRDGIYFGNGDPITTEAVRYSIERMQGAVVSSDGQAQLVDEMELVDDLTIKFTLTMPSAEFLYVLAEDAGKITNPAVVDSMDPDEFNLNPSGAGVGPYEFESFAPGEELVLRAKDDYWGGPVCIETLRFVHVGGARETYDAFVLGELDMAFLSNAPLQAAQLREQGVSLVGGVTNGQNVLVINAGREGTDSPMQDVRLRRAAAAAIDTELINDRVYEGMGIPGSALVADEEPWSPGVPGPAHDPELARSLVEEVKAEGEWDGTVTIVANNAPSEAVDMIILVEGMLEEVGFDVEVDFAPPGDVRNRIIVEASFDLGTFGISALEDAPTARYNSYEMDSPRNRTGYGTPEMDEALAQLQVAVTREEKREAMGAIQEIWNRDVPSLILGHGEWLIATADHVQGVFISRDVTPMFNWSYIDR